MPEEVDKLPVYKDENSGKWVSRYSYTTWDGQKVRSKKRGFATKREALNWEREFLLKKNGSLDMSFENFVEVYFKDISPRIKESTYETKAFMIDKMICPYFKEKKISEVTTSDVMEWQNKILRMSNPRTGRSYAKSYLKTIHNQLSAIFNHGVKYYNLKENPARKVGNMGHEKEVKVDFWTVDEYKKFSFSMMDKPRSFYCFEVLYWCGLRLGEMLALTPSDIDIKKSKIRVNKTYHKSKGRDIVTTPKTSKSIREVTMPIFLAEELQEYMNSFKELDSNERLFNFSKGYVNSELKRGIKEMNLKEIRVHDLRHSHVSLLIDMGYSAVAIANRVGHESIGITYKYAHMFPSVQNDMVEKLSTLKGEY